MSGYPGHYHYQGSPNHGHVVTWQQAMNRWGYGLRVDGAFGPATAWATGDFQRRQGLDPDQVVGPLTWARA